MEATEIVGIREALTNIKKAIISSKCHEMVIMTILHCTPLWRMSEIQTEMIAFMILKSLGLYSCESRQTKNMGEYGEASI